MAEGAYTTDDVPVSQLYTEFLDSVEMHNEQDRNFRQLLCSPDYTRLSTVEIMYRGKEFELLGSDTDRPDFAHTPTRTKSLQAPQRFGLNESTLRRAWEEGLSSEKMRADHQETLAADQRLIAEACLKPCLTDGGWYDTTITPPDYKQNTFAGSHDHYLNADVSGVPDLVHFVTARRHIQEHGYDGQIVAFINGAQTAEIEGTADWNDYTGPATDIISTLQSLGLTPGFTAAGIPVVTDDWIPEYYMLVVDLAANPLMWRVPEGEADADELMVFTETEMGTTPNVIWQHIEDYVRWVSATVYAPGAGVAYYLNGGSWTDSTGWNSGLP